MTINPVEITQFLREYYLRFYAEEFEIRDRELADAFKTNMDTFLFQKGPFLEITPSYQKGRTLAQLIQAGNMNTGFKHFYREAFPHLHENPLYKHQEQAILKVVSGRNLVISSGTGSGKTECFLLPIYDHLLTEFDEGRLGPGVRALLLYPMNALVNDQQRRLREISNALQARCPEIRLTFGKYTGDTMETRRQAEEKFFEEHPDGQLCPLELLSREEIRETPPHVLITNYSMLEYLLLRPQDCSLFDWEGGSTWKYLVLDESHTYNGATGIEIGLLMRRLKERIGKVSGQLRCISTSATIVGGTGDFGKVAEFASALFNEEFVWEDQDPTRQDVVYEMRESLLLEPDLVGYPVELIDEIYAIKNDETLPDERKLARFQHVLATHPGVEDPQRETAAGFVYSLLMRASMIGQMFDFLQGGSQSLAALFEEFQAHTPQKKDNLLKLIDLAAWARNDEKSSPLLPARYHLFIRGPDSLYVSLVQPRFFLNKIKQDSENHRTFEFHVCRNCGSAFLSGELDGQVLVHHDDMDKKEEVFLLKRYGKADPPNTAYKFCINCGHTARDGLTCRCSQEYKRVFYLLKQHKVSKCPECEYSPGGPGILRSFRFQQEAIASVLATALYHYLVREKQEVNHRKILIFSDSRQGAAYFASYFDSVYSRLFYQSVLISVLRENNTRYQDYRLESLANDIKEYLESAHLFKPAWDDKQKIQFCWKIILQEFSPIYKSRSLEGRGLLHFQPVYDVEALSKELPSKGFPLSLEETSAMVEFFLDNFRKKGALTIPKQAPPENQIFEEFNPFCSMVTRRGKKSSRKLNSILSERENSITNFLKRVVARKELPTRMVEKLLNILWKHIISHKEDFGLIAKRERSGMMSYRTDYRFWQVRVHDSTTVIQRCQLCGKLYNYNFAGVCPSFRCEGQVQEVPPKSKVRKRIHRQMTVLGLYQKAVVKIKEHTAQLTTECASSYQDRFKSGNINLLSCSTTFELGVDLGGLELIFLKNVPPSPANYIQRSGRAGRRRNTVGFTCTLALNRPHDLYFFRNPTAMINGQIEVPWFNIENEKLVRRHIHSVAFSQFWKQYPGHYGKVESFLEETDEPEELGRHETGLEKFEAFLFSAPAHLQESLQKIVPPSVQARILGGGWGWLDGLIGEEGVLRLASALYSGQMDELNEYKRASLARLSDAGPSNTKIESATRGMKWANRRIKTLRKENLISWLASSNVIPKYGFPVDVVPLRLLQGQKNTQRIKLERDLKIAISEYAPGSQVIANKYLWESKGLRVLKNKALPEYIYLECDDCRGVQLYEKTYPGELPTKCSICGNKKLHKGRFIHPIFGFSTARNDKIKKATTSYRRRQFARVPRFLSAETTRSKDISRGEKKFTLEYSPRGELLIICGGEKNRGFTVCQSCGTSCPTRIKRAQKNHKNPYGYPCDGRVVSGVHLGHKFYTDIIKLLVTPQEFESAVHARQVFLSVLYGMIEGTCLALGIPRNEINGCLTQTSMGYQLVFYDEVPGGAGHVRRLLDEPIFVKMLQKTWDRVASCDCGEDTSCYGCLRNYQNQRDHEVLKRRLVLEFLEPLRTEWVGERHG